MPPVAIVAGAAVIGGIASAKIGGRESSTEKSLKNFAKAGFESEKTQRFLPQSLQTSQTGDILQSGIQGIGNLIQNPGSLSPQVADAIRARLSSTSEGIASDFRGIRANQAGAGARSNLPVSIRNALSSALDVAQERAQRGARRGALQDTDALRRQDLSQTFNLLDAQLQFSSSGKGQAIQGLGGALGSANQRQAAKAAGIGSAITSIGGAFGGGGGGGGGIF